MEVHFSPETETKLKELATQGGQVDAAALVEEIVQGYLQDIADIREILDSRYDMQKSCGVESIDGEDFFENLRRRELALRRRQPL